MRTRDDRKPWQLSWVYGIGLLISLPAPRSFPVNTGGALALVILFFVTAVIGALAARLRRQARGALRQVELERLRGALLRALSHDLRTPLAALVSASAALDGDQLDAAERRELTRIIADESQRLNRLVVNLLELTRIEAATVSAKGTPQAIDEVIGGALRRLEPKLSGRPVRTDVPEEIPLVAFDPVLIEQVLINLLENALKHAPGGSAIEIAVREHRGEIAVDVADRGPGVHPGDEERVFEQFYRGGWSRRDDGMGLGLAICRAILTAHEGTISLQNRPGGGVVVGFTLPIRGLINPPPRAFAEMSPTELA